MQPIGLTLAADLGKLAPKVATSDSSLGWGSSSTMDKSGFFFNIIQMDLQNLFNVNTGLITPPNRSTRSTRSNQDVKKPPPAKKSCFHSSKNENHQIPMGKDQKTNCKPSDSWEETSGNAMLMQLLQKIKVIAHKKIILKKLFVAGWGFLKGGSVVLFVGGGQLSRGVAFLSSQKQHCLLQLEFNQKSIIWEMIFFHFWQHETNQNRNNIGKDH